MATLPRCDRCRKVGAHLCRPRAQRVVDVFERVLVHTKGRWARRPFILDPWQRDGIIVPLFGEVRWSDEAERYLRRFQMAWVELARKNGKSELLAGIALVLLTADDEEGAEVYSLAVDVPQARKVFDVAERMVELSPVLSPRIESYKQARRLVYPRLASYYEVVPADAAGNLGHNPHGTIVDEVLTQPDDKLWNAMRTAMGTRDQPLMIGATTADDDPTSFCAMEHKYSQRVAEDPSLDPSRFVFMRNTPIDADPFDEKNWALANPALDRFLSRDQLRAEAREARNEPAKEHAFRQFHMNQWLSQALRWMPAHLWDTCTGTPAETAAEMDDRVAGQRCFGGLDLSSKHDLTSICWFFPLAPGHLVPIWRFWIPEDQVESIDRLTGGQFLPWVKAGWVTPTSGAVIDYDLLYQAIDDDRERFRVVDLNHDPAMAAPIVQELEKRGLTAVQVTQGFAMSEPIKEVMRLVVAGELKHGGNPVARWNLLSTEVKQDPRERLSIIKPRRGATGARVDGTAALVMAVDGWMRRGNIEPRKYRAAGF
jgi:phage terminase large subunit-like protein